jgi:hypothetical protein
MAKEHRAASGDCFLSVADGHGFPDWKPVYDHPDNGELKKLRQYGPFLAPGDVVMVPDLKKKQMGVATGQRHTFTIDRIKAKLRINLDAPEKSKYELQAGHENQAGAAKKDTAIEAPIPPDLGAGTLVAVLTDDTGERRVEMALAIGHLHPPDTISGIQGRLTNLGYYWGPVDGALGDETRAAVARFQAAEKIKVTGDPDQDTTDAIRKKHDED